MSRVKIILYLLFLNEVLAQNNSTFSAKKMSVPVVTLNDGHKMPFFGLGTYSLKGQEGEKAIKYAIEVGYRHIDTAFLYENEKEVGNAVREKIKDGTIKREDVFITTKLDITSHREDLVLPACKKSIENLGLDYADLFLIHTPASLKRDSSGELVPSNIDYVETWRGLQKCKQQGLARSIGVSNFNSEQIARLIRETGVKPANNQVEVSVNLNQKRLIDYCKKNDITVTGYSPLGKPGKHPEVKNLWENPKMQEITKKYGKTPAQISLRFVYQMGAAPIPKSATHSRIKENIEIFDFALTDEEMSAIENLGTGERNIKMEKYASSLYYPFSIPF